MTLANYLLLAVFLVGKKTSFAQLAGSGGARPSATEYQALDVVS